MPAIKKKSENTQSDAKRIVSRREGIVGLVDDMLQDPSCKLEEYPLDGASRAAFRTREGKKVTDHQWAVYDITRTIPRGRVTTYGALCKALGKGSPRSVGSALRHNPFAPFVPCHRVLASNLYIGGFFGEWGTSSRKNGVSGRNCQKKMEMLAMEGVEISSDGFLADENLVWTNQGQS